MKTFKLVGTLLVFFLLLACLAACSETRQAGEDKAGTDAAAPEESPEFEADFESGDTSEWSDETPKAGEDAGEGEAGTDEADESGGTDESPDP